MRTVYPYSGDFRVTSPYGERVFNGEKEFHRGIDLVGISSKLVCAVCSGKVEAVVHITDKRNTTWQWGLYVKIRDCADRLWYYCHLSAALVCPGQSVEPGCHIGIEGSTGYSTGSHLHLELRENGIPADVSEAAAIPNSAGIISPDYRSVVKARFGLSDETADYLSAYRWGYDLLRKLAEGG